MPHYQIDNSISYAWLIPLLPLLGFLVNGLVGARLTKAVSGAIGTASVFGSFALACILFLKVLNHQGGDGFIVPGASWFNIPGDPGGIIPAFKVNFELLIDPLSALMMMIITGVGGLIHLYSTAYMAADKAYSRFFTYLNLFVFFMLLLVMGNNFLQLFVGWEGVGLCSYLLIGFFYEKKSAGDAAKKAFIVNRIGDVGVLIGMFMIFKYAGTLDFYTGSAGTRGMLELGSVQAIQLLHPAVITTMMLMLFFGATGKSAQIPLYTWLPDAMEGPTPVSALIHAATMVTAGIYMVSRAHSLFVLSDTAMGTIAAIGITTAIFAATIGLMQNDIKRVLAYSTVSQLGYMFAACGVGAFAAGMYHVMTHAFFKACLFLGSGSVIHAVEHGMHAKDASANSHDTEHNHSSAESADGPDPHDPQDMRNMGGLFPRIRITAITMMIATAAIAGVPVFAGFWSKDEILWRLWSSTTEDTHIVLWLVGAVAALITAFYMVRMVMKTFFGAPRSDAAAHAHESSLCITIPLMILAALSALTGWAIAPFEKFAEFLRPSVGDLPALANGTSMEDPLKWGLVVGILLSMFACYRAYVNSKSGQLLSPQALNDRHPFSIGWTHWVIQNKYFVDEFNNLAFVRTGKAISNWLWLTFDVKLVDGVVNGVAGFVEWSGATARRTQTGFVRNYAFSMVIGIVFVLIGCLAFMGQGR